MIETQTQRQRIELVCKAVKRKVVESLSNIYYLVKIVTFFNIVQKELDLVMSFCNIILSLGHIKYV